MRNPIPVNIITGFLGTGKTTAILDLLARKPAAEKWAVLVNEFGEIGVDGAILAGCGAEIREVPGGCMCCAAGLPMKVALNNLIARAQPDRLLIEPSGLGHPQEVVDTLRGDHYGERLDLRAVIALVDARKLADARYLGNQTFNQQLALADVIAANKTDLASATDKENFECYIDSLPQRERRIGWVAQGVLDLSWLDLAHGDQRVAPLAQPQKSSLLQLPAQVPLPSVLGDGEVFVRRENRGEGHYSCGWRFAASSRFSFGQLMAVLSGVTVDRLKAVLQTEQGAFVFNAEDGVLSVKQTEMESENLVEVIHSAVFDWSAIERQLCAALR